MAILKGHMLREVAISLCAQQPSPDWRPVAALPSIETFVLAGKEPFRIFRRIVEDYVTVTSAGPREITVKYLDNRWQLEHTFLCTLFAQWTRKVHMDSFRLCHRAGRGCAKMLTENRYIEEFRINQTMLNKMSVIQRTFPELTTLGIPAYQLSDMLESEPTEPNFLNKIVLTRLRDDEKDDLIDAHEALATHQAKWSSLETIRYINPPLEKFCTLESTISTVKHIEVETRACAPFDFSFLTHVQKLFPSLKSVEIVCSLNNYCNELQNIYQFYEAFELLNFGFFLKVTIHSTDIRIPRRAAADDLYRFLCTKGTVYKKVSKWTVKTYAPGKELIYDFEIFVMRRGNF